MLCERKEANLKVIPFDEKGELRLGRLDDQLLSERTRIVALVHASNSLGTINPVKEVIRRAHERDIPVMLDGAQMVQHGKVDVQELDCDFYVFSSHKIFGPTGSGVLYGKEKWLEELPPYQGGGDMVDQVSFEKTTYNTLPFKFEAGTTHYAGAIGLAAALEYLIGLGMEEICALRKRADSIRKKAEGIPGLRIYGGAGANFGVLFPTGGHPCLRCGMILDKMGIAVRTGTHCTQPVMDHFGISGTIRASLVFYNTRKKWTSWWLELNEPYRCYAFMMPQRNHKKTL
jgi:cysteine desulfurase/selenocysteine lyase